MTEVVAWAASNGNRSEKPDYQYGKRRLLQIDGRIRFLIKRIEAAEVVDRKLRERSGVHLDEKSPFPPVRNCVPIFLATLSAVLAITYRFNVSFTRSTRVILQA